MVPSASEEHVAGQRQVERDHAIERQHGHEMHSTQCSPRGALSKYEREASRYLARGQRVAQTQRTLAYEPLVR